MNAKTAKLIRKYCFQTRNNVRDLKRTWLRLDQHRRHLCRLNMLATLKP